MTLKKKKTDIKVCGWCGRLFIGASCQSHTLAGIYCKAGCVKKAEEWGKDQAVKRTINVQSR